MANPKWLNKYLTMKPEVKQIFNDIDAWRNFCRFNMTKFDPADVYRSAAWKTWQERRRLRQQRWRERQQAGNLRNDSRGQRRS